MNRRQLLATLGAGVVAGCASAETDSGATPTETSSPTPTPTETPSPTPTSTPEPSPQIEAVAPITDTVEFDSLDDVRTGGFAQSVPVILGLSHSVPVIDNRYSYEMEGRLLRNDEVVEAYTTEPAAGIEADNDYASVNSWIRLDPGTDLESGSYTGRVLVRDTRNGTVDTARTPLAVAPAFEPDEVTMTSVDSPRRYEIGGEPFSIDVTFRNLSDRASSIVTSMSLQYEDRDPVPVDNTAVVNLAAGGEGRYEDTGNRFESDSPTGSYSLMFDDIDEQYTFEVVE